jgi:histidine triad (HIT) family protein
VNLSTSKGEAATQSVFHLHVHVVPRQEGDRLPLPWTPQHTARATAA